MKTIFNLDKVRICLMQPENLYDKLYKEFHDSRNGEIHYDGFYLLSESKQVNDKDITAKLFVEDETPIELGTFTFNKSAKYGRKCFFSYSTKCLYEVANLAYEGVAKGFHKYSYFSYPFYAFSRLGLVFNNVSSIEIACDTDASVINRIQYAVGKPEQFEMILLGKKVESPEETLVGFWEYYQRSRIRKASRPTLYIHPTTSLSGNGRELKVYDKARELAQARPDKEILTKVWNGMTHKIQRMEIRVENKQFKQFFKYITNNYPDRWLFHNPASTTEEQLEEYRDGLEYFFYELGMDEKLRATMFNYFANLLLHFKLRNHEKTQVSILDLLVNSLTTLKNFANKKSKPSRKPNK